MATKLYVRLQILIDESTGRETIQMEHNIGLYHILLVNWDLSNPGKHNHWLMYVLVNRI